MVIQYALKTNAENFCRNFSMNAAHHHKTIYKESFRHSKVVLTPNKHTTSFQRPSDVHNVK